MEPVFHLRPVWESDRNSSTARIAHLNRHCMKQNNNLCREGLLLLLMLRQAHGKSERFRDAASETRRLNTSTLYQGEKWPIARVLRRLPVDTWQGDSWSKVVEVCEKP